MLYWVAAYHQAQASAQGREWHDELARHQAIYEELPGRQRRSALALTRDLAGWSPPQPYGLGEW